MPSELLPELRFDVEALSTRRQLRTELASLLAPLNTEWECWAVFHDVEIREIAREPIERENPAFEAIANHFDLRVF